MKGPGGVSSVLCNWPYLGDARNAREAHEIMKQKAGIRTGLQLKGEGEGLIKS